MCIAAGSIPQQLQKTKVSASRRMDATAGVDMYSCESRSALELDGLPKLSPVQTQPVWSIRLAHSSGSRWTISASARSDRLILRTVSNLRQKHRKITVSQARDSATNKRGERCLGHTSTINHDGTSRAACGAAPAAAWCQHSARRGSCSTTGAGNTPRRTPQLVAGAALVPLAEVPYDWCWCW